MCVVSVAISSEMAKGEKRISRAKTSSHFKIAVIVRGLAIAGVGENVVGAFVGPSQRFFGNVV